MASADSRPRGKKAKTARRPPGAAVPARTRSRPAAPAQDGAISPEDRHRIIAEAAYYRAEQRRFTGGDPLQDWLEAEAEVAIRLRGVDPRAGESAVR